MGDYDDYSDYRSGSGGDSGGIIGAIISIFILAAIWPYILAAIALYIAYIAAVAILEWIAQNPFTVVCLLLGTIGLYAVFRYHLIPKAWKVFMRQLKAKPTEIDLPQLEMGGVMPNLADRKFIPSTNLYCYWCAKKLGIKAYEFNGKYYCQSCNQAILNNKLDGGI